MFEAWVLMFVHARISRRDTNDSVQSLSVANLVDFLDVCLESE